jgi:type IV pilus assembly protein PilC
MSIFQYTALDAQGVEIKDEIEALSQKEAISKIRNMGYFPTKVTTGGPGKKAGAKAAKPKKRQGAGGKVKVKHITQFARQLSTLQDAGLPILRSLRILEEQQKSGTFKRIIGYVADDIEGGSTLSEALGKYPRAFDRLLVSMVAAGETGGVLDLILSRVADFMEKTQKLKARVKGAMIYPCVVLSAAFLILNGLMLFVVPQFETALTEMTDGAQLPRITRVVLSVSGWISKGPILPGVSLRLPYLGWPIGGWLVMLSTPIIIIFILRFIRRFRAGRLVLDIVKLKTSRVRRRETRFTLTCSTTFTILSGRAILLPVRSSSPKPLTLSSAI